MIYTIFIKKNKKDIKPFVHVTLIKQLLTNNTGVFILGLPGYIGTTVQAIDDFYDEIKPANINQLDGFFLKPMNVTTFQNNMTNEDYMNQKFGTHPIQHSGLRDHSKIMAFLIPDLTQHSKIETAIDNGDYDVMAILIGSSNQSEYTYCHSPAPKGEADVFLVQIDEQIDESGNVKNDVEALESVFGQNTITGLIDDKNVIISKEIGGDGGDLKSIIQNLLS